MSATTAAPPLFVFDSFSNWTWSQAIGFVIFNLIALEALGWLIFLWETKGRTRIPPGGKLRLDRDWVDYTYIWTNKVGTAAFNYHTFRYCWTHAGNGVYWKLNEMTIFNTIVALPLFFLAYDMVYSLFHRALHHRSVYGFVHKHHHKQRAPVYGNDDAINTHPIEFWIGAYLHLFAIWIVPCHMAAVLVFLILITLMSAFNHTRFEIIWGAGYLYDNREHDTHHKDLLCNYAAYTQFWDWLLGTYRPWKMPETDYLSYPDAPGLIINGDDITKEENTQKERVKYFGNTSSSSSSSSSSASNKGLASVRDAPSVCVVAGSSGLVGQRLVSMLVQRGAIKVVAVDNRDASDELKKIHKGTLGENAKKIEYITGDICDEAAMTKIIGSITIDDAINNTNDLNNNNNNSNKTKSTRVVKAEVVFNVAALVGPYYPLPLYDKVNNIGAQTVLKACKNAGVKVHVFTSSPSTRMNGIDIYNKREDELPPREEIVHLQEYARTKALGEKYVLGQNGVDGIVTTAIGPHQVYGTTDRLFLPSFVETAKNNRLRVLGTGMNIISFCHTDNCSHAHILAARLLLDKGAHAPIAGKYYIVTDGGAQYMWGAIDKAVVAAGFRSLKHKFNINACLLYPVAYAALFISKLTGKQMKLNPFVVKMVSMHRYFNISNICNDMGYRPIRSFTEAWPETVKACCDYMNLPFYPERIGGNFNTLSGEPDGKHPKVKVGSGYSAVNNNTKNTNDDESSPSSSPSVSRGSKSPSRKASRKA